MTLTAAQKIDIKDELEFLAFAGKLADFQRLLQKSAAQYFGTPVDPHKSDGNYIWGGGNTKELLSAIKLTMNEASFDRLVFIAHLNAICEKEIRERLRPRVARKALRILAASEPSFRDSEASQKAKAMLQQIALQT